MWVKLSIFAILLVGAFALPGGRIVGGHDAEPGQFPYQISLRNRNSHTCGGSIIDEKWILTAAHCVVYDGVGVEHYPAEDFSIRAGSNNRIAGGVLRNVKRVIVNQGHENFLNDLALLELTEPLEFNEKIKKIDLLEEAIPTGEELIISGWGLLKTNGDHLPILLQYNTVTALTTGQCKRKVLSWSDSLLCLSHPKGAGACNGDSGGPAAYKGKLAGVAGFVITGCGSSRPDGYAKVSVHLDWIRKNMES